MRFNLVCVNMRHDEVHPDKTFFSMDDLLAYVRERNFEWTSLVVTVLP